MNRFLSLADLTYADIDRLLATAKDVEASPIRTDLAGKVVGLVFLNPSLRTLASMQAGVAQLGGSSFVIQPGSGSWKLESQDGAVMDGDKPEHIREAIPVLAQYADVLGVRCFADGSNLALDLADGLIQKVANLNPKPTINLESAADHPCQALADWKTLDDLQVPRTGGKFVLSWAWHPKPLPYAVPQAAATMAALRGMDVTVLHPEGFELPDAVAIKAKAMGRGTFRCTTNREEALEGADVLYVKSWAAPSCYGRPEADWQARSELRDWCVDEGWFRNARPNAHFMHCLPIRRNVKAADEVLDGPRSVVLRQAANRLHVQKAVLLAMAGGEHG